MDRETTLGSEMAQMQGGESKRRFCFSELKSKDFQKSLREYIWLVVSICLAYSITERTTPWLEEILQESFVPNEFQGQAIRAILSSAIFALIFLHQKAAHLFLFINLGFFVAMQYSRQTYAVVTCTQLLGVGYFIFKYSYKFAREWIVVAEQSSKSKQAKIPNSMECVKISIFALGPFFALVVLAKELVHSYINVSI